MKLGTTDTKKIFLGTTEVKKIFSGTNEIWADFQPFTQSFSYTGAVQSVTIPYDGIYKFEVWGAQGGSRASTETGTALGGKGAYAYITAIVNANTVVYILVGGQDGGYNGNANGGSIGSNNAGGSGGGATEVRFGGNSRDWAGVIAGGGGGAGGPANGGYGGNPVAVKGGDGAYANVPFFSSANFGSSGTDTGGLEGTGGMSSYYNTSTLQTGEGSGASKPSAASFDYSADGTYYSGAGGGGGAGYSGGGGGSSGATGGSSIDSTTGRNGNAGNSGYYYETSSSYYGGTGGASVNKSNNTYAGPGGGGGAGSSWYNTSWPLTSGGTANARTGNGYCTITRLNV